MFERQYRTCVKIVLSSIMQFSYVYTIKLSLPRADSLYISALKGCIVAFHFREHRVSLVGIPYGQMYTE